MTEYQSWDGKARNRPGRPRLDEVTGLSLCRVTGSRGGRDAARHGPIVVTG